MGGCVSCCDSCCSGSIPDHSGLRWSADAYPDAPQPSNSTRIRRSPSFVGKGDLEQGIGNQYETMEGIFAESAEKYATRKCMGTRALIREFTENREVGGEIKPWSVSELGSAVWETYAEVRKHVLSIGGALAEMGLKRGDVVALYDETGPAWMKTAYACWSQGFVITTVYATLSPEAVACAIEESAPKAVLTNTKLVGKLGPQPGMCLLLSDSGTATGFKSVKTIKDMCRGPQAQPNPPTTNDLALIMYTSGTGGAPKGVMMSHKVLTSAITMARVRLREIYSAAGNNSGVYLAYLPLAHILELTVENSSLSEGMAIGYGNPKTLTDTSATPHGDLKEYKPVVFAGVPRVWDTVKKGIESKVKAGPPKKAALFARAMEERKSAMARGKTTPVWDKLVFKKLKMLLGGNVKYILSGGAPLSATTHEFLEVCFGCQVGQGYGLTETCALVSLMRPNHFAKQNVGGLVPGVEVKLLDSGNWLHTDDPPRGEICVRGPAVSSGYYKQPEKTAEAWDEEGWFHTGDVGTWSPDGSLKIIGRTKALAKLSHGEYIALEALEATYGNHPLALPNSICIVADSHESYIVGLICTSQKEVTAFCDKHSIPCSWPAVLDDEAFLKAAVDSFAEEANRAKLLPVEKLKKITFLADEWSPENQMLTAAMKLKRNVIEEKYAPRIKAMYGTN